MQRQNHMFAFCSSVAGLEKSFQETVLAKVRNTQTKHGNWLRYLGSIVAVLICAAWIPRLAGALLLSRAKH
jgi:hypothetical protein